MCSPYFRKISGLHPLKKNSSNLLNKHIYQEMPFLEFGSIFQGDHSYLVNPKFNQYAYGPQ